MPVHRTPSRIAGSRGFTLVELLGVILAAALLASIALPAYSNFARRSQLPEAFAALADFRVRMEQHFQDHQSYGASTCADDQAANTWNRFAPTNAVNFRYECTLDAVNQVYTITAIGVAGHAVGNIYSIDQQGRWETRMFMGHPVSAKCWLTKDHC